MVGQLRGLSERQLAEKTNGFLRLLSLYQDRFVPISSYSKGMRQKVLLAAALLHNPAILLLDEPPAPVKENLLRWWPSYWFLGLFQELQRPVDPVFGRLAARAVVSLLIASVLELGLYALAY